MRYNINDHIKPCESICLAGLCFSVLLPFCFLMSYFMNSKQAFLQCGILFEYICRNWIKILLFVSLSGFTGCDDQRKKEETKLILLFYVKKNTSFFRVELRIMKRNRITNLNRESRICIGDFKAFLA
jgi:hypothetical protein